MGLKFKGSMTTELWDVIMRRLYPTTNHLIIITKLKLKIQEKDKEKMKCHSALKITGSHICWGINVGSSSLPSSFLPFRTLGLNISLHSILI